MNEDISDTPLRPLLTDPGEPLLLGRSPIVAGARFGMFAGWSHLPDEDVISTPLVAVPMPRYHSRYPDGRRRWPELDPRAMWHPLMWLPRRLAGRMVVERDGDGSATAVESSGEWAVRVALEMSASGLYDQEHGQWVDVLALAGLDIEEPATLSRVDSWLAGGPDQDLEHIDLEEHLDVGDPSWSFALAQEIIPDLTDCSYALAATALIEAVDDITDDPPGGHGEGPDAPHVAGMIAALADVHMPQPQSETSWDELAGRLTRFAGTRQEFLDGPLRELSHRLHAVHDDYEPRLDQLQAAGQ